MSLPEPQEQFEQEPTDELAEEQPAFYGCEACRFCLR